MENKPKRRWYQFSLRTMFVLVLVVSVPLAWVGYSLNWIRQRQEYRKSQPRIGGVVVEGLANNRTLPLTLQLLGEPAQPIVSWSLDSPCTKAEVERLFPEAYVLDLDELD